MITQKYNHKPEFDYIQQLHLYCIFTVAKRYLRGVQVESLHPAAEQLRVRFH